MRDDRAMKHRGPAALGKTLLTILAKFWLWVVGAVVAGVVAITISTPIGDRLMSLFEASRNLEVEAAGPLGVVVLDTPREMIFVASEGRPLTPKELDELNSLDQGSQEVIQWFRDIGAVPATPSDTQIQVTNPTDETIRILNMRPDVDCGEPLNGTLFYSPGAGMDTTTRLHYDLDNPTHPAESVGEGEDRDDFFREVTVSLKPDEQYVFNVTADTTRACEFDLIMQLALGSEQLEQRITRNDSSPFFTSSVEMEDYEILFDRYPTLYLGGVAAPEQARSGNKDVSVNSYNQPEWIQADPATY